MENSKEKMETYKYEVLEVISADSGLAEGTMIKYNPETEMYESTRVDVEIGEGYEYKTTHSISFSKDFVEDNLGILFSRTLVVDTDKNIWLKKEPSEKLEIEPKNISTIIEKMAKEIVDYNKEFLELNRELENMFRKLI